MHKHMETTIGCLEQGVNAAEMALKVKYLHHLNLQDFFCTCFHAGGYAFRSFICKPADEACFTDSAPQCGAMMRGAGRSLSASFVYDAACLQDIIAGRERSLKPG